MKWAVLLALASAAPYANAMLRFPCAQLVTQRFDPLVTPNQVSPHVHQIVGGVRPKFLRCLRLTDTFSQNAFDIAMDPSVDYAKQATCTTCRFKENSSNYWTAVLYFKHSNGSYIRVRDHPSLHKLLQRSTSF